MTGDIQGTALAQSVHKLGDVFRRNIIDPGLLHHQRLPTRPRILCVHLPLVQAEAHQVGSIQAAVPKADADGRRCEQRWCREAVDQNGHQRQTGGCGELSLRQGRVMPQRHLMDPGQLKNRRHRHRQQTVGGADAAAARRRRIAADLPRSQVMDGCTDPHHIHQGVDSPHFVKVDRFRGLAMDRGLRLGQSCEHRHHRLLQPGLQRSVLELRADLSPVAMGRIGLQTHNTEATPPQTTTAGLLQIQAHPILQPQLCQGGLDHIHRNPKIKESRQQHVARQSSRAVDMQRTSGLSRGHRPSRGAVLNSWSALWLRSA